MKKSELIDILNQVNGDPEIVLSSDPEGNRMRSAVAFSEAWATDEGYQELCCSDEDFEWYKKEYGEEVNKSLPAIILWPM